MNETTPPTTPPMTAGTATMGEVHAPVNPECEAPSMIRIKDPALVTPLSWRDLTAAELVSIGGRPTVALQGRTLVRYRGEIRATVDDHGCGRRSLPDAEGRVWHVGCRPGDDLAWAGRAIPVRDHWAQYTDEEWDAVGKIWVGEDVSSRRQ